MSEAAAAGRFARRKAERERRVRRERWALLVAFGAMALFFALTVVTAPTNLPGW